MPTEQLHYWFPLLTDNSPFLFAVLDQQHNYLAVNNRYCEISGLERHELIGLNDNDTLGPTFYRTLSPYYQRAFAGETVEGEVVLDDSRHDTSMHFSLSPLRNTDGQIQHVVLHCADTSERQVLVNTIQELEKQLQVINQMMHEGCCIVEENTIISANANAAQLLGFESVADLQGTELGKLLLDGNNKPIQKAQLQSLSRGESRNCQTSPYCPAQRALRLSAAPIPLLGTPARLVLLQDNSQQLSKQDKLEHLVHTDPLTGMLNRHGFSRKLEQTIKQDVPFFMLYLDIDNFKNINDSLGHHIGDQVLQEIGKRLVRMLPDTAIIGHLSGDEFAILLPNPEHHKVGDLTAAQVIA
ncbi:diguanylate cyclase [Photobacterium aphoticum]|uniref:Diguanylate cyclase n=1 Tax=Photobacterium aphoticum TaxID=754436 RepID=A0A090QW28_9GAMM|nr:diguanylate cyclase [Photobacterium aphoticum]